AGCVLEADDLGFTTLPAQHAAVGQLATAARVERRLRKGHLARPGGRYGRRDDQSLGMFVTEEMHPAELGSCARPVLAKIVGSGLRCAGKLQWRDAVAAFEMLCESALVIEADLARHLRDRPGMPEMTARHVEPHLRQISVRRQSDRAL